jgi:hypothetical protein
VHKKVSGSKTYSVGLSLAWGVAGGGEEGPDDTASVGSRVQGTTEGKKRAALNKKMITHYTGTFANTRASNLTSLHYGYSNFNKKFALS